MDVDADCNFRATPLGALSTRSPSSLLLCRTMLGLGVGSSSTHWMAELGASCTNYQCSASPRRHTNRRAVPRTQVTVQRTRLASPLSLYGVRCHVSDRYKYMSSSVSQKLRGQAYPAGSECLSAESPSVLVVVFNLQFSPFVITYLSQA